MAKAAGALTLVDAAQSVPHQRVDVGELGCDFLAWSGHKMFGPTGTGALFGRRALLARLMPLHVGGGTIKDVGRDSFSLQVEPPYVALEAGFPDIAGIIGFAEAADFLREIGDDEGLTRLAASLPALAAEELRRIPRVSVFGPIDSHSRAGVVSFVIEGVSSHHAGVILDEEHGILVRSAHHCALPLMREVLGLPRGTVRASFHYYSTPDDVEKLVRAVRAIAEGSS